MSILLVDGHKDFVSNRPRSFMYQLIYIIVVIRPDIIILENIHIVV